MQLQSFVDIITKQKRHSLESLWAQALLNSPAPIESLSKQQQESLGGIVELYLQTESLAESALKDAQKRDFFIQKKQQLKQATTKSIALLNETIEKENLLAEHIKILERHKSIAEALRALKTQEEKDKVQKILRDNERACENASKKELERILMQQVEINITAVLLELSSTIDAISAKIDRVMLEIAEVEELEVSFDTVVIEAEELYLSSDALSSVIEQVVAASAELKSDSDRAFMVEITSSLSNNFKRIDDATLKVIEQSKGQLNAIKEEKADELERLEEQKSSLSTVHELLESMESGLLAQIDGAHKLEELLKEKSKEIFDFRDIIKQAVKDGEVDSTIARKDDKALKKIKKNISAIQTVIRESNLRLKELKEEATSIKAEIQAIAVSGGEISADIKERLTKVDTEVEAMAAGMEALLSKKAGLEAKAAALASKYSGPAASAPEPFSFNAVTPSFERSRTDQSIQEPGKPEPMPDKPRTGRRPT